MALALYLLPILLHAAASRIHHHRDVQDLQHLQDKLAGVDLAEILVPILSKQEQDSKANNNSDKRVHALKKLIERSHVAIILAKPQDKGENNSTVLKNAVSEELEKHKLTKHQHSFKKENYKLLKLATSKETSEENDNLDSIEGNKSNTNNFRRSDLNTKHIDSNSQERFKIKNEQHVSEKEDKEEENHLKNVEHQLKNLLNLKHESSESDDNDGAQDNLHKNVSNSKENDSHEDKQHLLENNVSRKEEQKINEEHGDSINLLKDLLNAKEERYESKEKNVEEEEDEEDDDNDDFEDDLDSSELNVKYKDSHESNYHKNVMQKNENKHVLRKDDHKDKVGIKFKLLLNSIDDISNFKKDSVVDSELGRSGSNKKVNDGEKNLLLNHTLQKESNKKGPKNSANHLQDILYSRDESAECDEEDNVVDHNGLIKNICLARLTKSMHFYDTDKIRYDGGVRNLYFHFA